MPSLANSNNEPDDGAEIKRDSDHQDLLSRVHSMGNSPVVGTTGEFERSWRDVEERVLLAAE